MKSDPFLDAPMRGWLVNTVRREAWRVSEVCDPEELLQEAYFVYYKCRNRYSELTSKPNPTKEDLRWFQSLVKTALTNHINTIAAKHKGVSVKALSQFKKADGSDVSPDDLLPAGGETVTLRVLIAQAPEEIKTLIKLLIGEGDALIDFARVKIGRRSIRETTNEYYCRLLKLDPRENDIVGTVRQYFS